VEVRRGTMARCEGRRWQALSKDFRSACPTVLPPTSIPTEPLARASPIPGKAQLGSRTLHTRVALRVRVRCVATRLIEGGKMDSRTSELIQDVQERMRRGASR